jgi:hypothetical protein
MYPTEPGQNSSAPVEDQVKIVRTQDRSREVQRTAPALGTDVRGVHVLPTLRISLQRIRPASPDIVWAVFVGLNLVAMRLLSNWQTVPFLAIWIRPPVASSSCRCSRASKTPTTWPKSR